MFSHFRLVCVWSCWLVALLLGHSSRADMIIDDFENQPVNSGPGTPLNYFSFGDQLTDRGVSNQLGATSGSNAAFYAMNFDLNGFGVGAARENLNLSIGADNLISVNLKINSGATNANAGFIGFRLTDADGTIVRTADANLFSASDAFQTISQTVSEVTLVDREGGTSGLNLDQITSVGLLFIDRGFTGTATIVFDDLRIVAVPEPSSLILVLGIMSIALARYRSRYFF